MRWTMQQDLIQHIHQSIVMVEVRAPRKKDKSESAPRGTGYGSDTSRRPGGGTAPGHAGGLGRSSHRLRWVWIRSLHFGVWNIDTEKHDAQVPAGQLHSGFPFP